MSSSTAPSKPSKLTPIAWANNSLRLLDQRKLPGETCYLEFHSAAEVADAIRAMVVRGAPAIGIVAAYGVALSALANAGESRWKERVVADVATLGRARPTAVNLGWALARMRKRLEADDADPVALLEEARAIHAEDLAQNRRMAALGAALLGREERVYTHCNTGALATGGYGTALGVIRTAWSQGRLAAVYAGETRPWLQGARLTVWELARERVPVTLVADSAAGLVMRQQGIGWVIVGADRITANGDVVNKIGTYNLAILARHHGARFMVVAPSSSVDMALASGASVPIEMRGPEELWNPAAGPVPDGVTVSNPAFDVTPAALVDVIVTERGVIEKPAAGGLVEWLQAARPDTPDT